MKGLHPSPSVILPTAKLFPASDGSVTFPRTEAGASADLRENFRVLNDVADELYFTGFLEPNQGFADAGLVRAVVFPDGSYIEFPNVGTPVWWHRLRRRKRWLAAGLYLKIWYTSDVGAAANFTLDVGVREGDAGDVMGAGFRLTYAPSLSIPGPAVAGTVLVKELSSTTNSIISGQKDLVQFSFNRNPADANGNLLRVLGVYFEVLPQ